MSTNFYIRKKDKEYCPKCSCDDVYLYDEIMKCAECNYTGPNEAPNKTEEIHIGKRAGGWQFLFNSKFESAKEWKSFIKQLPNSIFDEYGTNIKLEDMLEIVEIKGTNGKTATREQYGPYRWDQYEYFDDEGYRFFKSDFS